MDFNKYHVKYDLKNFSFLVTGGAGFIGSNIVNYLVQYGAKKIRILDNLSTGSLENVREYINLSNVEFIKGDITSISTCKKCIEDIDFISHQAALGSVPRSINDPIKTNKNNISGFLNILNIAKDMKVKRMVYAASSSTYGDSKMLPKRENFIGNPLSPYAVTKYVNELYAKVFSTNYNYNTIGLRYFNVFGPKQNPKGPYAAVIPIFISQILNDKIPTINGDGKTSRDFTFVSNIVQANIKSIFLKKLNKNYILNIACGERNSLNNLIKVINKELKKNIKPNFKDFRPGDVMHSHADISLAKKLINYSPEILFEDGIKLTIPFFNN
jgi:UDP-N-acetylglucosamine/UDP-N-acetylgalactosamine 4-epimerase